MRFFRKLFKRARQKFRREKVVAPVVKAPVKSPVVVKPEKSLPPIKNENIETVTVSKFAFNTDGAGEKYKHLSNSHQSRTATGIGNGGEILGYTLPLESNMKKIRALGVKEPIGKNRAAILEFVENGTVYRLLAVANDTGGRWGESREDRQWGELGVNTYDALRELGAKVKVKKNSLSVPSDLKLTYHFLPDKVFSVDDYRELKQRLTAEGKLS